MAKHAITLETVKHVARLARLEFTNKELKKFQKELNEVLAVFKNIDRVRADCEPSFQPFEIKDVFQEDKEGWCLAQEKALANAKHKERNFFKGPRAV